MASDRLKLEWVAWVVVLALILAVPVAALSARWMERSGVVEVHASMPEKGGWQPGNLTVRVGEPLRLRLTSDDVVHGFRVGQSDHPPVEVLPGQVAETTLR
jgi:heme/copper-type cytochrome/quinol oxidase subunit 2